jgi:hypothetical protein
MFHVINLNRFIFRFDQRVAKEKPEAFASGFS